MDPVRKGTAFLVVILSVCLLGLGFFLPKSGMFGKPESRVLANLREADAFSESLCIVSPGLIPVDTGEDYVILRENIPEFNLYDLKNLEGQHYSQLDELGRCGAAFARLCREDMPTEPRGEIGQIKPSGWVQKKYEGIVKTEPPYLYHRCHLLAYGLTGENANEKNLITGTAYMNKGAMLTFEKKVMKYLDHSENHVLYRVTPYFDGDELVARGVEIEAYSVEDNGEGLCFHVFVYNHQPGILIDYATGESSIR